MDFTQAIQVLRSGGTIERQGRSFCAAGKDDHGRASGGIIDVTDPEQPEPHKWSDDDRAAEDWIDPLAPQEVAQEAAPEVISPEAVDEAIVETPAPSHENTVLDGTDTPPTTETEETPDDAPTHEE